MKNLKMYKISFKNGLHNTIKVEASNSNEARINGLIAFRKDIYFPDFRSADEVVDKVEEVA